MPKYLFQGSYSLEGVKGLLKDGGSKRRAAVEQAVQGVGGKLETFHFAFGGSDFFVIADLPDNISSAALSLAVSAAGGAVNLSTVVLISPEEMDQATQKTVTFRPPGH